MELVDKIDNVLEWLYLNSGSDPNFSAIKDGLKHKPIDEGEIDDCLKKLHKDGFLYFMRQGQVDQKYDRYLTFLITFDGKYFWETVKGYRIKYAISDAENSRVKNLEIVQTDYQKNIVWLTVVLVVGTVPVGLLALADLYWKYKWFQSAYWWRIVLLYILLSLASFGLLATIWRKLKRPQKKLP